MPSCALKIGDHVWKIVSKEKADGSHVEKVTLEEFTVTREHRLLFNKVRTNKAGTVEYVLVRII